MLLVFVVVLIEHHNFSRLPIEITIANNNKKVNRSIIKQNAILAPFSHGTFFAITSRASTERGAQRLEEKGHPPSFHLGSFLGGPVLLIGVADSVWCLLSFPPPL
jgi:hypothetical protein